MTVCQVRAIFSQLLRKRPLRSAEIAEEISDVLRRNEEARIYHWHARHKTFPPHIRVQLTVTVEIPTAYSIGESSRKPSFLGLLPGSSSSAFRPLKRAESRSATVPKPTDFGTASREASWLILPRLAGVLVRLLREGRPRRGQGSRRPAPGLS
jgi:hypothetical protein